MNESKLKSSVMFRMFVTACVGLILVVLALFVESLISERKRRSDEARTEVAQKWAGIQTITGPTLTVPIRKPGKNEKGKTEYTLDFLHIMPETLRAGGRAHPGNTVTGGSMKQSSIRPRSGSKGRFFFPEWRSMGISPEHLLLEEAFLTVGIGDLRGIKNAITLNWDGAQLPASPGIKSSHSVNAGFTVSPGIDLSRKEYPFSADLRLNGSGEFNVIPVGKERMGDAMGDVVPLFPLLIGLPGPQAPEDVLRRYPEKPVPHISAILRFRTPSACSPRLASAPTHVSRSPLHSFPPLLKVERQSSRCEGGRTALATFFGSPSRKNESREWARTADFVPTKGRAWVFWRACCRAE